MCHKVQKTHQDMYTHDYAEHLCLLYSGQRCCRRIQGIGPGRTISSGLSMGFLHILWVDLPRFVPPTTTQFVWETFYVGAPAERWAGRTARSLVLPLATKPPARRLTVQPVNLILSHHCEPKAADPPPGDRIRRIKLLQRRPGPRAAGCCNGATAIWNRRLPTPRPPCGVLQLAIEELQPPARRAATRDEECYHNAGTSGPFCWKQQIFLLEPTFFPSL